MIKVADYICSRIGELTGSRHVFLLSGGGMMHLLDSVGRSGLSVIAMHHEQAVGFAAYAYGRTLNTTGVCFATSGPGGTNMATPVAAAYTDSVPLLVVSGQVSTLLSQHGLGLRQRGFQEFDIVAMMASTTKYAKLVRSAQDVRYELEKACFLARSGRPGPVWLDIPLDVQAARVDVASLRGFDPVAEGLDDANPAPDATLVGSVLAKLKAAKRPLIVLGHGVVLAGAVPLARRLLERLAVPVQTTWNAIDVVPEAHPLYFGRANAYGPRYPNLVIQNADYILTIGARLGVQHTGYNVEAFARGAFLDMVDLDPVEAAKPGLKVDRFSRVDARKLLQALDAAADTVAADDGWIRFCRDIKRRFPVAPALADLDRNGYVDPYYFVRELSDALPDDALVPLGSSGTCFTVSGQVFQPKSGQRVFHAKGMAAMGSGVPSAIGACIAAGGKPAVTVVGDGGFQLNIQELQTIVHHGLPLKMFVLNNGGYHAIRVTQETYFERRYVASTLESGVSLPSLERVAHAYGIGYSGMRTNGDVAGEIARALAAPGPQVIEVFIDPSRHLLPKLGSYIKPDGTMSSRPLEDLVPLLDRDELKSYMHIPVLEEKP